MLYISLGKEFWVACRALAIKRFSRVFTSEYKESLFVTLFKYKDNTFCCTYYMCFIKYQVLDVEFLVIWLALYSVMV